MFGQYACMAVCVFQGADFRWKDSQGAEETRGLKGSICLDF